MYLAQIMRYPPTFLLSYLKIERHFEWQVLCQYMFAYKTETPFFRQNSGMVEMTIMRTIAVFFKQNILAWVRRCLQGIWLLRCMSLQACIRFRQRCR